MVRRRCRCQGRRPAGPADLDPADPAVPDRSVPAVLALAPAVLVPAVGPVGPVGPGPADPGPAGSDHLAGLAARSADPANFGRCVPSAVAAACARRTTAG